MTVTRAGLIVDGFNKLLETFYTIKFSEIKKGSEDLNIPNLIPVTLTIIIPLSLLFLNRIKIGKIVLAVIYSPLILIFFMREFIKTIFGIRDKRKFSLRIFEFNRIMNYFGFILIPTITLILI